MTVSLTGLNEVVFQLGSRPLLASYMVTVSVPLLLAWIMFWMKAGSSMAISPIDESRKQSPICPWWMSSTLMALASPGSVRYSASAGAAGVEASILVVAASDGSQFGAAA